MDKVERYDRRIEELAALEPYREPVRELCCFLGIKKLTALATIVEVGDFNRFSSAEKFASYLGLVPEEDSSGEKHKRLSIAGNSPETIAYADRANERLSRKYYRMVLGGKKVNVAKTAIARELACFIWGMMTGSTA